MTDLPIRKVLQKPDIASQMVCWVVELSEFDVQYEPRGPIKGQVYADFVVEHSSEATQEDDEDFQWVLFMDGSSNQQGIGARIILEGPNGLLIEQALIFDFKARNNQAEYEALVASMFLAKELGARSLLVKSDSLLVIGQVTGEYQAKDPQMTSYLRYVTLLRDTFPTFELMHVPREQNARADQLAKLASSGKGGQQRSVIQETLKSPRIAIDCVAEVHHVETSERRRGHRPLTQETWKAPKVSAYCSLGEEPLDVGQLDVGKTWMTPYKRYLADGMLLEVPAEVKVVKRNAGRYTVVDGKLFRHGYIHPILTCVSRDQCTRIMTELHEGICRSHVGGRAFSEGRSSWGLLTNHEGRLHEVCPVMRAMSKAH